MDLLLRVFTCVSVWSWTLPLTAGITRTFYLAIKEDYWTYIQNGTEPKTMPEDGVMSNWPIGLKFKKALYREYTDKTFSTETERPPWQGYMGPTLKAEQGDIILIVLFNNATVPFSFHTHGVAYDKNNEGALYNDGVHFNKSMPHKDIVQPGETFTYHLKAIKDSSPGVNDPDCLTWLYHSHVDTVKDVNTGLVGVVLLCRPGTLSKDRGRHYSLYPSSSQEAQSWFKGDNYGSKYGKIPSINGFMFGQIPGLEACVGETVTWHFAALGATTDIHSISISGHSFEFYKRREHNINTSPARFATAMTTSLKPGKWLIRCNTADYINSGMYGYLNVKECPGKYPKPPRPINRVRFHYIAAEEVMWNYAPTGMDGVTGDYLSQDPRSQMFFKKGDDTIGGVYKKSVYREYDDFTFKSKKIQDKRPKHLGILGPVIRAEVGDLVQIVFKNMASRPYSIHAEGVMFSKRSEGMSYVDGSPDVKDNAVAPGDTYTYFWYVPEEMAPTENDPRCLTRRYSSGVDLVKDFYSGLIGPLIVCKPGTLDKSSKRMTIDKEFFLTLTTFDENKSWYLGDNMRKAGIKEWAKNRDSFTKSNLRSGINGFQFANLPGLDMCVGESVAWHVFTDGEIPDVHSFYTHGDTFYDTRLHGNSLTMFPGDRKTLYMKPGRAGVWKLDCATVDHPEKGETAIYTVRKCPSKGQGPSGEITPTGKTRTFYIQAEVVDWNYAPLGKNMVFNKDLDDSFKRYYKVLYRGYTDANFTHPRNQTGQEYLGIQGPLMRVEVGEKLRVVFRNIGPRPFSIHPQRLMSRSSDLRVDQGSVSPGNTFTYEWIIGKAEGPGPREQNCVNSPYYSDVNVKRDLHTGLIGTLVVCKPGILDENGLRTDVDEDFSVHFSIIIEGQNWLMAKNKIRCLDATGDPSPCNDKLVINMNGYVFGNGPPPVMHQGDRVAWYLMTVGNKFNIHPVHFHGNDVNVTVGMPHSSDVSEIGPGSYTTVLMKAINPGNWLFHCHVNSHIKRGMEALYEVLPTPKP